MSPFGIANYRSFNSDGIYLEKLSKVNVFIGKNNCGKSNILKFLWQLSQEGGKSNSKKLNDIENRHMDLPGDATLVLPSNQHVYKKTVEQLSSNKFQQKDIRPLVSS